MNGECDEVMLQNIDSTRGSECFPFDHNYENSDPRFPTDFSTPFSSDLYGSRYLPSFSVTSSDRYHNSLPLRTEQLNGNFINLPGRNLAEQQRPDAFHNPQETNLDRHRYAPPTRVVNHTSGVNFAQSSRKLFAQGHVDGVQQELGRAPSKDYEKYFQDGRWRPSHVPYHSVRDPSRPAQDYYSHLQDNHTPSHIHHGPRQDQYGLAQEPYGPVLNTYSPVQDHYSGSQVLYMPMQDSKGPSQVPYVSDSINYVTRTGSRKKNSKPQRKPPWPANCMDRSQVWDRENDCNPAFESGTNPKHNQGKQFMSLSKRILASPGLPAMHLTTESLHESVDYNYPPYEDPRSGFQPGSNIPQLLHRNCNFSRVPVKHNEYFEDPVVFSSNQNVPSHTMEIWNKNIVQPINYREDPLSRQSPRVRDASPPGLREGKQNSCPFNYWATSTCNARAQHFDRTQSISPNLDPVAEKRNVHMATDQKVSHIKELKKNFNRNEYSVAEAYGKRNFREKKNLSYETVESFCDQFSTLSNDNDPSYENNNKTEAVYGRAMLAKQSSPGRASVEEIKSSDPIKALLQKILSPCNFLNPKPVPGSNFTDSDVSTKTGEIRSTRIPGISAPCNAYPGQKNDCVYEGVSLGNDCSSVAGNRFYSKVGEMLEISDSRDDMLNKVAEDEVFPIDVSENVVDLDFFEGNDSASRILNPNILVTYDLTNKRKFRAIASNERFRKKHKLFGRGSLDRHTSCGPPARNKGQCNESRILGGNPEYDFMGDEVTRSWFFPQASERSLCFEEKEEGEIVDELRSSTGTEIEDQGDGKDRDLEEDNLNNDCCKNENSVNNLQPLPLGLVTKAVSGAPSISIADSETGSDSETTEETVLKDPAFHERGRKSKNHRSKVMVKNNRNRENGSLKLKSNSGNEEKQLNNSFLEEKKKKKNMLSSEPEREKSMRFFSGPIVTGGNERMRETEENKKKKIMEKKLSQFIPKWEAFESSSKSLLEESLAMISDTLKVVEIFGKSKVCVNSKIVKDRELLQTITIGNIKPDSHSLHLVKVIVVERFLLAPHIQERLSNSTHGYRIADGSGSVLLFVEEGRNPTHENHKRGEIFKNRKVNVEKLNSGDVIELKDARTEWIFEKLVLLVANYDRVRKQSSGNLNFTCEPNISSFYAEK